MLDQIVDDRLGDIDGNGEADVLSTRIDSRVDTYHFTGKIEQWSARIALVNCSIRLQEIDIAVDICNRSAHRRDDAQTD